MATPSALDHVDAVTAALTGAGLTVYLGGAPSSVVATDTAPYCVLYPSPGTSVIASLADDPVDYQGVIQVTAVGVTAEQALNVFDRAASAMAPPPSVTGRASWRPEPLDDQPVTRDDHVNPPVWYAVGRWRLRSIPQ